MEGARLSALSWRIWYAEANFEVNSGLNSERFSTLRIPRKTARHAWKSCFHPLVSLYRWSTLEKQTRVANTFCRTQHLTRCPGCHRVSSDIFRNCGFRHSAARDNRFCLHSVFGNSLVSLQGFCVVHVCQRPCSPDTGNQLSRKLFWKDLAWLRSVVSRREAIAHKLRNTGLKWSSIRNGRSDAAANCRGRASVACLQWHPHR